MSELKTIFVEGREINVLGTKIIVKTISVGNIPVVLNLANRIFSIIKDLKSDEKYNTAILKAITEDFEGVLKLIEVTTNLDKEDIPNLNISAMTIILAEVIKENSDFLSLHVMPNLQNLLQGLKKPEAKSGLTKSKN